MKILKKSKAALILSICICFVFVIAASTYASQQSIPKYPDVVAKFQGEEIKKEELINHIEQYKIYGASYDQDKKLLKQMIINKLIDKDVQAKKIIVSDKEVNDYIDYTIKNLKIAQEENDPITNLFYEQIKNKGYDNIESYFADPEVYEATRTVVGRTVLKNMIVKNADQPSEADIDKYIESQNQKFEKEANKEELKDELKKLKVDKVFKNSVKQYLYQRNMNQEWEDYQIQLLDKSDFQIYI